VAPASGTLTATVTGAGAAGAVEFFNGATSMGTVPVAAGVATKAMTRVAAGSYSYTAKFIPTSAAAFTPSTSSAVAFVVTATVPTPGTARVTSLSPNHGNVGSRVTIRGTGFGEAGTVNFASGTARIKSWSSTKIVVMVPKTDSVTTTSHNRSGWYDRGQKVPVTVTPKGAAASNAVSFWVESCRDKDRHGDR
jgi:Bacterial Ig-like domain (group 3)/IPT/TIG domain